MTLEQRIINIAEKQNYYDSRELRAIAFEVRKREDRIKQLEEMYEGVIGERPEFLGSNVMGLLKRELNFAQNRIKRLEKDSDRLDWLLKRGLAWRGCYNGHWLEGEWLYSSQYAIETIDKAKEAKL